MNNLKFLIHIGYHKTGTTWLQKNIFTHPERSFNPVIPKNLKLKRNSKQAKSFGRNLLNPYLFSNEFKFDVHYLKNLLFSDYTISENLVNVVSSEALSGVGRKSFIGGIENCERIKEIFPKAKILIGIREQRSMIKSTYFQYLRMGGTLPPAKYFKFSLHNYFSRSVNYGRLNYHVLIQKYFERFGNEDVMVYPIEEWNENFTSFLKKLECFLELNNDLVQYSNLKVENYALKLTTLEVFRKLSSLLFSVQGNGFSNIGFIKNEDKIDNLLVNCDKILPEIFRKRLENRIENSIPDDYFDQYRESNRITSELISKNLKTYGYLT